MKFITKPLIFLLGWMCIGAFLRLANLSGKPPWIDEFATLIFSMGNSFNSVPLDRLISLPELLTPLVPNVNSTIADTVHVILTEDQHPPTYFVLNHLWLNLFPAQAGLVNLWANRLLSAIFGILAIPTIYIASYLIFRSSLTAQLTAAIMAVSPYAVYIAQEARHYTLSILLVIISIACFVSTCQLIICRRSLPLSLVFVWLLVNNLGMATHYFFVLTITAEIFGLMVFLAWHYHIKYDRKIDRLNFQSFLRSNQVNLTRLSIVGVGTIAGVVIWLKIFRDSFIPVLTDWVKAQISNPFDAIVSPLIRIIGYLLTDFSMLFAESDNSLLVIVSVSIMIPFFIWLLITTFRAIRDLWKANSLKYKTETIALISFIGGSVGLFLVFPYLVKVDITLAPRYQFVYFPAIVILVGFVLSYCWQSSRSIAIWIGNKQGVVLTLLMGFAGSCIVAANQGYLKSYDPHTMISSLEKSSTPILIATTHNNLSQVGEMMSIAWDMQQVPKSDRINSTQFLLAHQNQLTCSGDKCVAANKLREVVDLLPKPHDILLTNFLAPVNLPSSCTIDNKIKSKARGYEYHLYHC
jgi:uncharacterized membrane protein